VSALFLYRCPSTGARDAARRPRPPHLVGGQRAGHLVVMCRHAQTPLSETKHNTLWHKRIKLVTQHKESMHSPTRKGLCPIKPFLKAQLARAGVQGGGAKPPPPPPGVEEGKSSWQVAWLRCCLRSLEKGFYGQEACCLYCRFVGARPEEVGHGAWRRALGAGPEVCEDSLLQLVKG
jgi:hypothetical protein